MAQEERSSEQVLGLLKFKLGGRQHTLVAFPFSLACDLGTASGLLVCGAQVYSYPSNSRYSIRML